MSRMLSILVFVPWFGLAATVDPDAVEVTAQAMPTPDPTRATAPVSRTVSETAPKAVPASVPAPVRYRFWIPRVESSTVEATRFYSQLVDRYRRLTGYADTASVVRTIEREGAAVPQRLETTVESELSDGQLQVRTSASKVAEMADAFLPLRWSDRLRDARDRYDFWLAPHLLLALTDDPFAGSSGASGRRLEPSDVQPVMVDERPLLRLLLIEQENTSETAAPSSPESQGSLARLEVYVDPDSMLIERVEGEERLPDGANSRTTMEIRPTHMCDAPGEHSSASPGEAGQSVPRAWPGGPDEEAEPVPAASRPAAGDPRPACEADRQDEAAADEPEAARPAPAPSAAPHPQPDPAPRG